MEFPVGLGGVTLVVAAIVWLAAFVPGFTKRSQITETSKFVRQQQSEANRLIPMTKDEQLSRLINTQRIFSLLFGFLLLGSVALWVMTAANPGLIAPAILVTLLTALSLFVSRAAANRAASLASSLHRTRLQVRAKANKKIPSSAKSREWTPNTLPAPLANLPKAEVLPEPMAEVISISKPRKNLSGSEIDQILARRRAI